MKQLNNEDTEERRTMNAVMAILNPHISHEAQQ